MPFRTGEILQKTALAEAMGGRARVELPFALKDCLELVGWVSTGDWIGDCPGSLRPQVTRPSFGRHRAGAWSQKLSFHFSDYTDCASFASSSRCRLRAILPATMPSSNRAHMGRASMDWVNGSGGVSSMATTKQPTTT